MRDPLLNESLRRLAAEAATRFTTLVAGGDQIPFDVASAEGPDEGIFHSYVPLTARYVREREGELRSLPAFEGAREAVAESGVADSYLEQRGEPVPADPRERAAHLITLFLASLWDGCGEFSLDRDRLEGAIALLDAEAGSVDEADVVIAPLAGFRMPLKRLKLVGGAEIVRADSIEAPAEARRSAGMGREAWEPQFLAVAEQGDGPDSAGAALAQLREVVSVMRLFKPGGVGLGPYAFAPTGEESWRRIPTGSPAPRGDGYTLDEAETAELAQLAETLESRPDPSGPLAWAVRRFELGCERPSALEALSDHMLALRSVLEDQGPVGASLPMRAAALVSSGQSERLEIRERIEAAQQLERSLMAGAPGEDALGLAGWVEANVRRILRDAALGELGTDLNAAADESLIAGGLDAGDAQIAFSQEVETAPEPAPAPEFQPVSERDSAPEPDSAPDSPPDLFADRVPEFHPGAARHPDSEPDFDPEPVQRAEPDEEDEMSQQTRVMEPVPEEDEIRITPRDWLEEVEEDGAVDTDDPTLDFPAIASDLEERERIDTPRVRHLFPVPEDADWEVRELDYDHYNGRRTG